MPQGTSTPATFAFVTTPKMPQAKVTIALSAKGAPINGTSKLTGKLTDNSDATCGAVSSGPVGAGGQVALTLTPLAFASPATFLSLVDDKGNSWRIPVTSVQGTEISLVADPGLLTTKSGASNVTFTTSALDGTAMGTAFNVTIAPYDDGDDGNANNLFLTAGSSAASGHTTYSLASATIPSDALKNPENQVPSYLIAQLKIADKAGVQTNPYTTTAKATLGDLLAPVFNEYPGTKNTLTDADFTEYKNTDGFPWWIHRIYNAFPNQLVRLYAESANYPDDAGPYVLGQAAPLNQQTQNQDIVITSPTSLPVFQHTSDTLTLYYSATRYNASPFDEPAYSDPLTITLTRDQFTPDYSNLLRPPVAGLYTYSKKNFDAHETLKVKIDFAGQYKPRVGDVITVHLDLLGYIDNVNRNIPNNLTLRSYTLVAADVTDGVVLQFPNAAPARDGFTYDKFSDIDGSAGNLYYTVTPFNGTDYGTPLVSPPVYIVVDVIDPYSGVAVARAALRKRSKG